MNSLNLDVPACMLHMTRQEYNDLVIWVYDCTRRQVELMASLLHPMPAEKAVEVREEIAGITKLMTATLRERTNGNPLGLMAVTLHTIEYKKLYPASITPTEAASLASAGSVMMDLIKGNGL